MKNILLCTDGSSFAEGVYRYGAWFAIQFKAQINVLSVTDIRSQKVSSTGNLSGSIGLGASEQLLNELVNLEHKKAKLNNQRAKLILQNAAEVLETEGVEKYSLTNKTGFLVDVFHEFEENSDLIVLGKQGQSAFASGHLGSNVDRIIRSSGKPCLVTPLKFKPIDRILVAYDGSLTSKEILQFLRDFPCFQRLEIHILTVDKNTTDPTAIARINEAQKWLQSAGFESVCSILAGEAEKALTHYISQHNISLLLMGAYGHSRIRHLAIGSTTTQILQSSSIPILLFR
ncbi:universal stress protein [Gloeocapsopsis dulcis]|uniref:Universal stress protein n=1 Tax=Gloeocapsopsis dulcis AAB1 = 1H9 TaxID=1433147 RepID=A0A6N8G433_9CHRO|nr:universal stress protein [Gloeocapsopsis dulcis]MUL38937.1 universal stress protein [Gloeocapsopsis dulcis AAB1 = 1H9]WNN90875.1 universal stress protein [Gloeocapsopsis dulcis]